MMFQQFNVTIYMYVVEMNEWECRLYSSASNLQTFVSFCDKNMGVQVICSVGYSPENTVINQHSPKPSIVSKQKQLQIFPDNNLLYSSSGFKKLTFLSTLWRGKISFLFLVWRLKIISLCLLPFPFLDNILILIHRFCFFSFGLCFLLAL